MPLNFFSPHKLAVKAMVRAQEGFKEEAIDLFEQAGNYDRDTVPGRQCMASALILKKEFDKANVFLESVQDYLTGDDIFNWNYGLSLAASGIVKKQKRSYFK
ncbi:intraflagellar transport protein 56 [Chaetoceros tenuissimus]|uniref:Intraflagellar transport protein 56 n=1 Tax=Chaetoceros tenuissimus TaxID=426638 RepID=A0AAD3H495_9STRA|nr:intraflagellar transport protein 56 [Chaetoceros tenuissimus]